MWELHAHLYFTQYLLNTLFKTEILHSMHCIFHCQIRPAANKLQNYKTDIIENKIAQSVNRGPDSSSRFPVLQEHTRDLQRFGGTRDACSAQTPD